MTWDISPSSFLVYPHMETPHFALAIGSCSQGRNRGDISDPDPPRDCHRSWDFSSRAAITRAGRRSHSCMRDHSLVGEGIFPCFSWHWVFLSPPVPSDHPVADGGTRHHRLRHAGGHRLGHRHQPALCGEVSWLRVGNEGGRETLHPKLRYFPKMPPNQPQGCDSPWLAELPLLAQPPVLDFDCGAPTGSGVGFTSG